MSTNVRCAGDGDRAVIRVRGNKAHLTLHGEPCGWTARVDGWALDVVTGQSGVEQPGCPECGGRVELISDHPEVER